MKKLLLLGGSRYLLPVIDCCKKHGIKSITCDYLPHNTAHAFSDEYHNVSIIDKEAVLALALELKIDGIMSFACDPGVVTAAYVAEKMNLPFQGSYESVKILQDKGLFRTFLWDNGFNCPHAKSYSEKNAALADKDFFEWPVIVKPVDSAGSKGVTKVERIEDLPSAIDFAVENSIGGHFIIEDFLTFEGFHSSADPFTVNGALDFCTYSDQLFDKEADNPYTPSLIIWPSTMREDYQDELTRETGRLMNLLGMKTGIYNIETCVANGKPYLMEVSPRGGGCKIAEIQEFACGQKLIEAEVLKAVGLPFEPLKAPEFNGVWCGFVIHARPGEEGIFKELWIDETFKKNHVAAIDMTTQVGDKVEPFTGANKALGDMILHFSSREELDNAMKHKNEWMHIITEKIGGGGYNLSSFGSIYAPSFGRAA